MAAESIFVYYGFDMPDDVRYLVINHESKTKLLWPLVVLCTERGRKKKQKKKSKVDIIAMEKKPE